jgi:hypothetical protein
MPRDEAVSRDIPPDANECFIADVLIDAESVTGGLWVLWDRDSCFRGGIFKIFTFSSPLSVEWWAE